MTLKEQAYSDGYRHGYLSDEDLAEIGHTPQSYADYVNKDFWPAVLDPFQDSLQREAFYGLIDGANDKAKRR